MRSAIFDHAKSLWGTMRAEYQEVAEFQYAAAVEATNGNMVNALGIARGYDSWRVFHNSQVVLDAYGSPELQEWVRLHPRLTLARFEAEWLSTHLGRDRT